MAVQNRKKLFAENFLVYGFGGIISKLIPLIMVPIVTRLMPDSSYYGISDLSNTIISLFSAIAVLGMYDAMYRMFFEKEDEEYKKDICSSAFAFTLLLSFVVAALMLIFRSQISQLFFTDSGYGTIVMICCISVLVGSTNSIISAPTRMQNKRGIYLIMNTVSPILSYSISIPLLLNGYYLIALPIASACASITSEIIFAFFNRKWFSFRRIQLKYIWQMLKIALPLTPNFIIYWIFNSSDRVMISNMLTTTDNGIYAVAAKFGQISNLIYVAFAGGWQYFAFSIMKDKDNTKVVSKIFEGLLIVSLVTTMLGTSICKWGIQILFGEEYWSAYICIPYLYLAPLLLMLFQVGSNQFLVIKKTWPNMLILSFGAILNVALNLVLIPVIGIEGASIATFVGYLVSIILMIIVLERYKLLHIRMKTIIYSLLFILCFVSMRLFNIALWYVNIPVMLAFMAITFVFYWKDYGKKITDKLMKKKENDGMKPKDEKTVTPNSEMTDKSSQNAGGGIDD